MDGTRQILHVDMDAFFAAVEQRDHPEYRGQPVMVGSPPDRRGIIATCSYEARRFGVHSAMPSRTAGKLCPHGVFLPLDMPKYVRESKRIMALLRDFTPQVEPVSIDEAFLDVTGAQSLWGPATEIARQIKARLRAEIGLTASVGVASNKFLAKLASDLHKPDGLTVIPEENKAERIAPLPVGRIWGVGRVTQKILEDHGLKTIGDLQRAAPSRLESLVGRASAASLGALAHGEDDRPLELESEARSIGSEHTFPEDTADPALWHKVLLAQAEEVAAALRKSGVGARTVTLKLRHTDFTTLTRQTTLAEPTQDEMVIFGEMTRLLEREKIGGKLRLIGLSASGLIPFQMQLDLFDAGAEKRRRLAQAVDAIRARHGPQAIRRVLE